VSFAFLDVIASLAAKDNNVHKPFQFGTIIGYIAGTFTGILVFLLLLLLLYLITKKTIYSNY
jgi:hypothetical protein